MWLTDKQITVFPVPFYAKNVFNIEKTGTLLFCSVLQPDKVRTALEQFKAKIGRKLRTIYAELILPGFFKKSVNH